MTAGYPVRVVVSPQFDGRNRLTTAFRPILAIPHAILTGPVYWSYRTGGVGLLGAAAYVLAIVSWFTLLVTGQHLQGARDFALYYLRWRTRALAYMALLVDPYPRLMMRRIRRRSRSSCRMGRVIACRSRCACCSRCPT
jgi:hypothetical protein